MLNEALTKLFSPPVCSIWKAPNRIWTTNFARNKPGREIHPALVSKLSKDGISVSVIPATSKSNRGNCVYITRLNNSKKSSYFLLFLSMPYLIEDLVKLDRGWNGIDELNEYQKTDFYYQMKECDERKVRKNKKLQLN